MEGPKRLKKGNDGAHLSSAPQYGNSAALNRKWKHDTPALGHPQMKDRRSGGALTELDGPEWLEEKFIGRKALDLPFLPFP